MKKLRWALVCAAILLLFTMTGAAASADGAVLRFPADVTGIGEEAFCGDTSLEGVILPQELCELGPRAFAGSSATWVYFPGTIPPGGVAEDAFENVPLELVITPWDSIAGHWAEDQGIRVAWENELEIHPVGDDWVYIPYGETAELGIWYHGVYEEDIALDWFRIDTGERGEDLWVPLERHDIVLTTEPVRHHLCYVCRITDAFGFYRDAWFDVMVDNGQEIWPEGGADRVAAPEGQCAELRVGAGANDESVMLFQWFRVDRDENGFDIWVELENETRTEFTTAPVTGPARYVCRFTDGFGSMRDCWFSVDLEPAENSASAGKAHDIGDTSATIPLTYSVTGELAERGYRMGVVYSENSGDLEPDENGWVHAPQWTWGGESGVYGPCSNAEFEGWLDELIPGRSYWYSACITTEDGEIVFLEDTMQRFRTTNSGAVQTLTADEHAPLPAGGEKSAFRFVLPADGIYALNTADTVNEISVRGVDSTDLAHAWDTKRAAFYGSGGDTVYLFARCFDYDTELWVSAEGDFPTEDLLSADIAGEITATQAWIRVTYTTAQDTAERGYIPGVAFSTDPEALLTLNGQGELNCPMWDCWAPWDARYSPAFEEGEDKLIDELVPNTTYFYRAYLRVNGDGCHFAPAGSADELQSFTTGSGRTVPALTELSDDQSQWQSFPREAKAAFRFTAAFDGIYGVMTDRVVSELKVLNAGGDWINGSDETDMQFFPAHAGETVYIFARNWEEPAGIAVFYAIEFPAENAVSAELTDSGSTWVGLDVTYAANEETAEHGYFVGVAYSQDPDRLAQLNDNQRFDCDIWEWDWMDIVANDVPIHRHIDQLIPDRAYYFRPVIMTDGRVICFGDMVETSTAPAGDELQTLQPGGSVSFSGIDVTPVMIRVSEGGIYTLGFEQPVDQADLRLADDRYIVDGRGRDSVSFYVGTDEPVYLYLRNWDGSGTAFLSEDYTPAPTEDAIDARIAQDEDGNWLMGVRGSVTPETAKGGYGYRLEYSLYPDFVDENGNPRANILFRQNGDRKVRNDEADVRPLPLLVPGMHIYFRGVLNRFSSTELYGETHEFTVPGRDVPTIGVSRTWTELEANQPALYKFTASEAAFLGIEGEGIDDLSILREDGSGMRSINQIEHEDRYGFLIVGFDRGDTVYIRTAGGEGARIRVVPAEQSDFTLSEQRAWMWDNHFVRYTAGEAGWYSFGVDRADLAGNLMLFWNPVDGMTRLPFEDGGKNVSIYLPANQTVYFCAWYNMDQGQLNASVTKVAEAGRTVCDALLPEREGEPEPLALGDAWTDMPQDMIAYYSFTAGEAGFYAVDAENIYSVIVCEPNEPEWKYLRGSNNIENRQGKTFLVNGFDAGETVYIAAAGRAGARIRVVPEGDRGAVLGEQPQWVWDNRLTRFTAAAAGSYTVTVNDPSLCADLVLCRGASVDAIEPLAFGDSDTVTVSLKKNETVHFLAWYDMYPGHELYMSVAPAA